MSGTFPTQFPLMASLDVTKVKQFVSPSSATRISNSKLRFSIFLVNKVLPAHRFERIRNMELHTQIPAPERLKDP